MERSIWLLVVVLISAFVLLNCGGGGANSSGATQPYISFGICRFPTGSAVPPGFHTAWVVVKNGSAGADMPHIWNRVK